MTYQANDFMALRATILKNSIFNSLLASRLTDGHPPVKVGSAVINVEGQIEKLLMEERGKDAKLPKFVMVDVVATTKTPFTVGYSYKDSPTFGVKYLSTISPTLQVAALKEIARTIFSTYQIHSGKSDKIFSNPPKSLDILLECAGVSSNCWKAGFPKKRKRMERSEIRESELSGYYDELVSRLSDWRLFNTILIALNKEEEFSATNAANDQFIVQKTVLKNSALVNWHSCVDDRQVSFLLNYRDLKPSSWAKYWSKSSDIDPLALRSFFKA